MARKNAVNVPRDLGVFYDSSSEDHLTWNYRQYWSLAMW